jgi:hypothetical protein
MWSLSFALALSVGPPSVRLSSYDAVRIAYRDVGGVDADRLPFSSLREPRLLTFPERNVYEVAVKSWWPFDRFTALVDADTGRIVKKVNHTHALTSSLRVYSDEPQSQGFTLLSVETDDASALRNDRFSSFGCAASSSAGMDFYVMPVADNQELEALRDALKAANAGTLTWFVMPLCSVSGSTRVDEVSEPLESTAALATRDPFAEQNFFAHAERIAQWYPSAFSYNGRNQERIETVVNFAGPSIATMLCTSLAYSAAPAAAGASASDVQAAARVAFEKRSQQTLPAGGALQACNTLANGTFISDNDFTPFDNAFFMPKMDAGELPLEESWLSRFGNSDIMLFGQGTALDFAYDATVIYHEYTHAVVDALGALSDSYRSDEHGLDAAPGALNEGLADYFSMALTDGDGCVGPIAGALVDAPCLRNLSKKVTCPDGLLGEVHDDSLPMSTALWAARGAYGSQHETFDRAVFKALASMPADPSFAMFSNSVLTEAQTLGLDTSVARAAFTEANVLNCDRTKKLYTGRESDPQYVAGIATFGDYPLIPGVMQYTLTVTTQAQDLAFTVRDATVARGPERPKSLAAGDANIRILVSDEPVRFNPGTFAIVSDVQELELADRNNATLELSDGAHTLYFALINRGQADRYLTLQASLKAKPVAQTPTEETKPGCGGCHAASSGDGWLATLALTALAARSISSTRSRASQRDRGGRATRRDARG